VSKGSIDCFLKKKRQLDTFENKKLVRKILDNFQYASPTVTIPATSAPVRPLS
jgi:hypothetical protein